MAAISQMFERSVFFKGILEKLVPSQFFESDIDLIDQLISLVLTLTVTIDHNIHHFGHQKKTRRQLSLTR